MSCNSRLLSTNPLYLKGINIWVGINSSDHGPHAEDVRITKQSAAWREGDESIVSHPEMSGTDRTICTEESDGPGHESISSAFHRGHPGVLEVASMLEMTDICCHKGNAVFITAVNGILVSHTATWMSNGLHSRLAGLFDRVIPGKGKESIRGQT